MKPRTITIVLMIATLISLFFIKDCKNESQSIAISIPSVARDTIRLVDYSIDTIIQYRYRYEKVFVDTAPLPVFTVKIPDSLTFVSDTAPSPIFSFQDSTWTIYGQVGIQILTDGQRINAWEVTIPEPSPCPPPLRSDSISMLIEKAFSPVFKSQHWSVGAGVGYDFNVKSPAASLMIGHKWYGIGSTWTAKQGLGGAYIFVEKKF